MVIRIILLLAFFWWQPKPEATFLEKQKTYPRFRNAIDKKEEALKKDLAKNNINLNDLNLLFVAFKDNDTLEVFVKNKKDKKYTKFLSYRICARSGQLGPKTKQGDNQVPEGFYSIDRFNPNSNFYLSLGINYPNKADRNKNPNGRWGGDIFIHGDCVTIGCLPLTDDKIMEVYLLAVHAKNNGQKDIPVYIFPFRMNTENCIKYKDKHKARPNLLAFWDELQIGYKLFENNKTALAYQISSKGNYVFSKN